MERLNAALEGRYRIESEIGVGGMATVYLAQDLRHERRVALKVLKPELAAVVGAERFLAEIKTTANLQHPRILPLHDSGEADGFLYYVMPYIEGETLRGRLDREQQLPVDEAVRIATDVAEGLESAHRQGVIHRDIKPANILLSEGRPLVADFGIALAVSAAGAGRMTETGLSMGTPYYMSPEQASADRAPTPASDVYSLGCVLYEMLVGEPPYVGNSAQAVLAKILTAEAPAPTEIRPSIPANVDSAIRRSLEKLPADRFMGAHVFAEALGDPGFRHGEAALADGVAGARGRNRVSIGATVLAVLLGLAAAWGWLRPMPTSAPAAPLTADLLFPTDSGPAPTFALSPDGTRLAFLTRPEVDGGRIWIRSLETGARRPLAGTERALAPAWSPDGNRIAFRAGPAEIQVISAEGGPLQTVAELPGRIGLPAWHTDGFFMFVTDDGIWRASEDGSSPTLVVATDVILDQENAVLNVLPDGRGFVLATGSGGDDDFPSATYAGDLSTGDHTLLIDGAGNARYVDGWLVFVRSGTALAQRFDPDSRTLQGPTMPLVDDIRGARGRAQMSVSRQTFIFSSLAGGDFLALRWADRSEGPGERLLEEGIAGGWIPELSRDGAQIAWGGYGLWVADEGGLPRRIEGAPDLALDQRWSEDGRTLLFDGPAGLMTIGTNPGDTVNSIVQASANGVRAVGWGSQGEVLYIEEFPDGSSELRAREPGEAGQTRTVQPGATDAALSPNGMWLAYVSAAGSDDHQVFVRAYRGTEAQRISTNGGRNPRWAPRGDELYFVTPIGQAMSARIAFDGGLRPSVPTQLFPNIFVTRVMAHPDGRLLVNGRVLGDTGSWDVLHLIRDWQALGGG